MGVHKPCGYSHSRNFVNFFCKNYQKFWANVREGGSDPQILPWATSLTMTIGTGVMYIHIYIYFCMHMTSEEDRKK